MQNRTFSENCLRTLIDSCCALSLSSTALSRTGTAVQRLDYPVGLSPSSVQPEIREGQVLSAGSHVSKGGEQRGSPKGEEQEVSQGGKQESLITTSPIGEVASVCKETVTDPVHFDALVEFKKPSSISEVDCLNSITQVRQGAKRLRAANTHRLSAANYACIGVNHRFTFSI